MCSLLEMVIGDLSPIQLVTQIHGLLADLGEWEIISTEASDKLCPEPRLSRGLRHEAVHRNRFDKQGKGKFHIMVHPLGMGWIKMCQKYICILAFHIMLLASPCIIQVVCISVNGFAQCWVSPKHPRRTERSSHNRINRPLSPPRLTPDKQIHPFLFTSSC